MAFELTKPLTRRPMNRDPNFDITAVTAAIGPKNTGRYLKSFDAFRAAGRFKPTWHWPAAFATCYWLLYRKMWGWLAVYLVFFAFTQLAESGFQFPLKRDDYSPLFILANTVWSAIPPVVANWLYFRRCSKLVQRSQALESPQEQLKWLRRKGGASHLQAVLILVLVGVAIVAASLTVPAVQHALERTPRSAVPTDANEKER